MDQPITITLSRRQYEIAVLAILEQSKVDTSSAAAEFANCKDTPAVLQRIGAVHAEYVELLDVFFECAAGERHY